METKILEKFCELRDIKVQVVMKAIREAGNPDIIDWDEDDCLSKDQEICGEKGCMFMELGGKYPFKEKE